MPVPAYPPADRRLRLGIVGGGRGLVGRWHAAGARLSDRWELVAGCLSADPDRAASTARDWLLPADRAYHDYAQMAREEAARPDGIEAVSICTPNETHRPIAEAFMAEGIDVICDKPMTVTAEDAEALLARQREAGVVFAVTYPYPYHAMARQMREMIAEGAIGEIRQCVVEYAQEWAMEKDAADRWRFDPARTGRSASVADIGTHAFQLLEHVTGQQATALRADFHVCGGPKPLEDTAFISLRLSGGAPVQMWVSQAAPGNWCGLRLRVFGQTGALEWDQERPETLRHARLAGPDEVLVRGQGAGMHPAAERISHLPRGHAEGVSDAWANLYAEIAIAVAARRAGTDLPEGLLSFPDVAEGARGVRFVHAAVDSHEGGGIWLPLAEPY